MKHDLNLPEPAPGQIWSSPRPRVAARKILRVERWKYKMVVILEGRGAYSVSEFLAWARRVGAMPE